MHSEGGSASGNRPQEGTPSGAELSPDKLDAAFPFKRYPITDIHSMLCTWQKLHYEPGGMGKGACVCLREGGGKAICFIRMY